MKKILFICVHNSARSQMAEALVNSICGGEWAAESGGGGATPREKQERGEKGGNKDSR